MSVGRQKTLEQKLVEWGRAYQYVVVAIAGDEPRQPSDDAPQMDWDDYSDSLARWSAFADVKTKRTSAIVAAMLVGQNVRPLVIEEGEG